ncbi:MAG TPA: glycosyltransferase [Steroidobacteraceae bacterium]|nr:glycosyltransferase [Steroidobacteraceae bacterium]
MIPRILHYCFGMSRDFGGRPWSLMHYVGLQSAIDRIAPSRVHFYCEHEPRGPWWSLTRDRVNVIPIKAPRSIYGNPVVHYAHRADIVRLEKLIEYGGIYLDADVCVHRSFDDLLSHPVVLAQERADSDRGLCNAVILAEPGARFLLRWHAEYQSFRSRGKDDFWIEHSVQAPSRLARQFPDELCVLPQTAFYWPSWDPEGIRLMFESTERLALTGSYATHLWESMTWERYLKDLVPGRVRAIDSNFHRWARPYLEALPDDYGAPSSLERARRRLRSAIGRQIPPGLKGRLKQMLAP